MLEEQRKARLGDLDRAELDAARRLPLARRLPAVARGRGAAARPGVEEMPDELPLRARIDALDGDAKAPPPPRDDAVGTGLREGLDDGLRDLLRAVIGGERHRGGRERPHDRALLGDHLDRAERAGVLGRARIDQEGERHVDGRHHVGERGVDEAVHLGVRVGEIDGEGVALHGDRGADVDVGEAVPVVVQDGLAAVHAVLPRADARARLALGAVEDLVHRRHHRLGRRTRRGAGAPAARPRARSRSWRAGRPGSRPGGARWWRSSSSRRRAARRRRRASAA